MAEFLKRIAGLIPVAVGVITVLAGPPATAGHCPTSACCGKTFPEGLNPRAAQGYVWVCDWPDGCHHRCRSRKIKVKNESHRFSDCKEASQWANDTVGETETKLSPPTLGKVKITKNPEGTYTAKREVTWTLDTRTTVSRLPSVSWPRMNPAEKKAVQDFLDAVRQHEAGHVLVAESLVMDPYGPYAGEVKSDASPTEDGARASLQNKLVDLKSRAQTELDRVAGDDGEYDRVTDHGRNQSAAPPGFPGGPNIELVCPDD
jgi:Bacterial protein of unknown function (DUF922)